MRTSKILVTGGAGFIGSHLVERLLAEGHDVKALDRFNNYYDPRVKRANIEGFLANPRFELIEEDITTPGVFERVLEGVDVVFHNAGQAGVRASVDDPFSPHEINATATLRLLEAARRRDVRHIVNASSSSVYGRFDRLPISEDDPKRPLSPYGVSKLAAEAYCSVYRGIYGLSISSLRYFTVFGPRMRPDLAINIFVRMSARKEPIRIFGDGSKTRDYTYIDNIVEGNLLAAARRANGEFNVGGGERISVIDLANEIRSHFPGSPEPTYSSAQPGDAEHTWASIDKARKELGYEPAVSFREGLSRYIAWYKRGCGDSAWPYR